MRRPVRKAARASRVAEANDEIFELSQVGLVWGLDRGEHASAANRVLDSASDWVRSLDCRTVDG